MFFQRLWQWLNQPATPSRARQTPRPRARLMVECLEGREVPASFTAATVPDLIGAITAANLSAEADTITLAPGKTFTLTEVNNTSQGATGLPVIAAGGGSLTIVGNGDVIQRRTARGTPAFRLLNVAPGASLTLQDLTLQGGQSQVAGAISNQGTLTLQHVTVQKNTAIIGGGIYSNGSLTLQDCIIRDNQALGNDGDDGYGFKIVEPFDKHSSWVYVSPTSGGPGLGGGVYVAGGTAELLGTTVMGNTANGGRGGQGKQGQPNAPDGSGRGGGMYIESDAAVVLDAFTLDHITSNTASTSDPNIHGTYTLLS